jgi:hypothetical protein
VNDAFLFGEPDNLIISFSDRLDTTDLRHLSRSHHLFDCLPVTLVRKLMKEYEGGQLGLGNIVSAASVIGRDKGLDRRVVGNILRYQLPAMAKNFWKRPSVVRP